MKFWTPWKRSPRAISRSADDTRAHLETCPGCAAALATARRIEEALAARPVVEPPPRFTPGVLHRIRRDRWRSEERVDRLFNVSIAVAALLVLVGAGFLFNISAALQLASGASQLLSTDRRGNAAQGRARNGHLRRGNGPARQRTWHVVVGRCGAVNRQYVMVNRQWSMGNGAKWSTFSHWRLKIAY